MGSIGSAIGGVFGGLAGGISDASGSTNKFNAQAPDITKQNFVPQIENAGNNYNERRNRQVELGQALQAQAQGQGPNLAQLQLQEATNRNIQQNAGLTASQKGISPALAARLASQNAASSQQQMAGQSGMMRAQQQLMAQQQYGQQLGQMAGQDLSQQAALQNALAQQNNAVTQGSLGVQGMNSQVAQANANQRAQMTGQMMGAAGSLLGMGMGGGGGGAPSPMGGATQTAGAGGINPMMLMAASQGAIVPGQAEVEGDSPVNDKVPAMLSPGEIVIPRSKAKDPDKAKEFIDHLKGKSKSKGGEEQSYGKLLKSHREIKKRLDEIENQMRSA